MSKLLLIPLLEKDAIAKCVAIPAHPGYTEWLQAKVAHAKSINQYQGSLHSIQFYDRKALWLLDWPEGYGDVNNWRLDHTEDKEKRWDEGVLAAIDKFLWQPPVTPEGQVVFRVWQPDEARVLITQGGVNWIAYCSGIPTRYRGGVYMGYNREVSTEAITDKYLNYVSHAAGEIDQYPR